MKCINTLDWFQCTNGRSVDSGSRFTEILYIEKYLSYARFVKLTGIMAYAFWIPAVLFLGRYELRTDDTGVELFFVLLITFILGSLHPRHAWQWALLVGPCIPAAEWLFGHVDVGTTVYIVSS